jgi:DNA-binding transcriptional LysR family regulator
VQFNWNDLRFFLAMARTGSPTTAAMQLKVDHTTVRRRIDALEDSLKVKLFEPRDRGFLLTHAGNQLLATAESIEALATGAEESVSGEDLSLSGTVRIGIPDGLGGLFLSAKLAEFARQHPDLQLELDATTRPFNLAKREADIAISISAPTKGRQVIRKIGECRLFLYASADYLANAPAIRTAEDLKDHRFVGYFEDMAFAHDLDTPPYLASSPYRFLSSSLVALYEAVVAGMGICLLPCYLIKPDSNLQRVLPDEVSMTRQIWMTIHSDLKDIARYRAVAEFIRHTFAGHKHLFMPPEHP